MSLRTTKHFRIADITRLGVKRGMQEVNRLLAELFDTEVIDQRDLIEDQLRWGFPTKLGGVEEVIRFFVGPYRWSKKVDASLRGAELHIRRVPMDPHTNPTMDIYYLELA